MQDSDMTALLIIALLQSVNFCYSLENLALNKNATQSTNLQPGKWLAGEAVDGNVNQSILGDSCARTSHDLHNTAWWTVDLGSVFTISYVEIFYRNENNGTLLTYRLAGFHLYVTDGPVWSSSTPIYTNNNGVQIQPWPPSIFTINVNTHGRYVTIYKDRTASCEAEKQSSNSSNVLCTLFELCEVQVYGCPSKSYGPDCQYSCPDNCRLDICDIKNGNCFDCKDGYINVNCTDVCSAGSFGRMCKETCSKTCGGESTCDVTDGTCLDGCDDGYTGSWCNETCEPSKYGPSCQNICGFCANSETCNNTNGKCPNGCGAGKTGDLCKQDCDTGFYGNDCTSRCSGHCLNNVSCNIYTGNCDDGCVEGYHGEKCDQECSEGSYGENCRYSCSGNCVNGSSCNAVDGNCDQGCQSGWIGDKCDQGCPDGMFGDGCVQKCGHCNSDSACDRFTGNCGAGCSDGYTGRQCMDACRHKWYGKNCSFSCDTCNVACHFVTGECMTLMVSKTDDVNVTGCVIVLISMALVIIILLVVIIRKLKCGKEKRPDNMNEMIGRIQNEPTYSSTYQSESAQGYVGPTSTHSATNQSESAQGYVGPTSTHSATNQSESAQGYVGPTSTHSATNQSESAQGYVGPTSTHSATNQSESAQGYVGPTSTHSATNQSESVQGYVDPITTHSATHQSESNLGYIDAIPSSPSSNLPDVFVRDDREPCRAPSTTEDEYVPMSNPLSTHL